jgi:hypothetical protein
MHSNQNNNSLTRFVFIAGSLSNHEVRAAVRQSPTNGGGRNQPQNMTRGVSHPSAYVV